ncbi:MAG: hypothetical protein KIT84_32295 [Labilithrix sp.]|nr:hypothetical protein [Labilithrix sp.]MCW5815754.1 hypothetical protein [Labilithrix sp.]
MLRRVWPALPLLLSCANPTETPAASDAELHLEEGPIPTALTELKAGLPYLPGIDESPLALGAPCVADPKITITPGQVGSAAAVVQTRDRLSRELGFGINGTIPVAGGITGAAGLTYTTSFDDQSAVVLFQSTGTYESVLTGASALASYDADAIWRCGFGYVARASHRVTAALVVTVRAVSNDKDFKANAGLGKTGVAEAKASISNLIQRGHVEISIRFATDVIPKLPRAPFADTVIIVGTSESDKQKAQEKLARSLGWLAEAQSTIEGYLGELRANAEKAPPAPAQSITFRYYPGTPNDIRAAVDRAVGHANDTKVALRKARAFVDAWEQYAKAGNEGTSHEWNVPLAPAATVADLDRRKTAALEKLRPHERELAANLDACVNSLRNDRTALDAACTAPPALPLDERANDIRRIAYLSTEQTRGAQACPAGQRLPKESEAAIFSPWSKARAKTSNQGLWMAESGCTWSAGWIYDGAPGCSNMWIVDNGLRVCLSNAGGPMPPLD